MAKPQEKELPVSAIATDLELCEKSEFVAADLTEATSWTIECVPGLTAFLMTRWPSQLMPTIEGRRESRHPC